MELLVDCQAFSFHYKARTVLILKKIIQFLKEEGFKYELKYEYHQETQSSWIDPHMAGYHEAVARNNGSDVYTSVVTVSDFKGIIIYI